MGQAYADMVSKVRIRFSAPQLEFYDDLRGVGGLFIADAWSIAVGQKDIEAIVDRLLATRYKDVAQVVYQLGQAKGVNVSAVRTVLLDSAMARCIAHELGHALIHVGCHNPYAPDGEAGADYYAGRLDAARGIDWQLGEMFFRAIGCVGPTCTHPSPQGRSSAYCDGFNEQYAQQANAA